MQPECVAVPTGSSGYGPRPARGLNPLRCLNIRGLSPYGGPGLSPWHDLTDDDVLNLLDQ